MANVAVTAANVIAGSNAVTERGIAGETITAGQPVYRSNNQYFKADMNASAAAAHVVGIALNSASLYQPLIVQTKGDITIGGTLVAGTTYYLSDTAGSIATDVPTTGDFPCLIGVAKSTTVLGINITYPGISI